MNQDTTDVSLVKWALGGAALGALTMFLIDPDRGNRRRALAKDKAYSTAVRTRKQIDAKIKRSCQPRKRAAGGGEAPRVGG